MKPLANEQEIWVIVRTDEADHSTSVIAVYTTKESAITVATQQEDFDEDGIKYDVHRSLVNPVQE